jgi:hypothetical protein
LDDQHKQHIIDLPKTVAGGIAAPVGALLTSRFGVAGTMIGLALSAVVVTMMADTLKVYLARVPGAVTSIPGGFKKKSAGGKLLSRLRLPFSKLASLPASWRRTLLIRSLIGGAIMFVIGLVIVTGVELSVGKNLSCWVWDNCYTQSSSDSGENATDAGTLPSILIAGNSISASAPRVSSSAPQKQSAPAPPVAPTPPAASPSPSASGNGSRAPISEQPSAPPSEQQQSSSLSGDQQRSEYPQQVESQQQSEYSQQGQYQESSQTSSQEGQQQSLPNSSATKQPSDSQQQSPTPPASPTPSGGADGSGF